MAPASFSLVPWLGTLCVVGVHACVCACFERTPPRPRDVQGSGGAAIARKEVCVGERGGNSEGVTEARTNYSVRHAADEPYDRARGDGLLCAIWADPEGLKMQQNARTPNKNRFEGWVPPWMPKHGPHCGGCILARALTPHDPLALIILLSRMMGNQH